MMISVGIIMEYQCFMKGKELSLLIDKIGFKLLFFYPRK